MDQIETASGAVPESVLKMILGTSPDTGAELLSAKQTRESVNLKFSLFARLLVFYEHDPPNHA